MLASLKPTTMERASGMQGGAPIPLLLHMQYWASCVLLTFNVGVAVLMTNRRVGLLHKVITATQGWKNKRGGW